MVHGRRVGREPTMSLRRDRLLYSQPVLPVVIAGRIPGYDKSVRGTVRLLISGVALLWWTTAASGQPVIVVATAGQAHHQPDGVRHEADGDTHGWLQVDSQFVDLINPGNRSDEGGNLVFEIVCHYTVTQSDARPACEGFADHTSIPPPGTHVAITGTFVQEKNHKQWNEIHPVSRIEAR